MYMIMVLIAFSNLGSSYCGSVVMNPTGIHEDTDSILGLTQWVKDLGMP